MDQITFFAGVIVLSISTWLLIRALNDKKTVFDAFKRLDIVTGFTAGFYLVISSLS